MKGIMPGEGYEMERGLLYRYNKEQNNFIYDDTIKKLSGYPGYELLQLPLKQDDFKHPAFDE